MSRSNVQTGISWYLFEYLISWNTIRRFDPECRQKFITVILYRDCMKSNIDLRRKVVVLNTENVQSTLDRSDGIPYADAPVLNVISRKVVISTVTNGILKSVPATRVPGGMLGFLPS